MASRPIKVQHFIESTNNTILLEPNYVSIGPVVGIIPTSTTPPSATATDITIREGLKKGIIRRLTVRCGAQSASAKTYTVYVAAVNAPKISGLIGLILNNTAGNIRSAYYSLKLRFGA